MADARMSQPYAWPENPPHNPHPMPYSHYNYPPPPSPYGYHHLGYPPPPPPPPGSTSFWPNFDHFPAVPGGGNVYNSGNNRNGSGTQTNKGVKVGNSTNKSSEFVAGDIGSNNENSGWGDQKIAGFNIGTGYGKK